MTTIYVSALGNDMNPGTLSLPVLTLPTALSLCSPGYTIWVLPDGNLDHNGIFTINKANITLRGTSVSQSRIVFAAMGSTPPIPEARPRPVETDYPAIRIAADGVTIRDIELYGVVDCVIQCLNGSDGDDIAPTIYDNFKCDTVKFTYFQYSVLQSNGLNGIIMRNCTFLPLEDNQENLLFNFGMLNGYNEISNCSSGNNKITYGLVYLGMEHVRDGQYLSSGFSFKGQFIVKNCTFNYLQSSLIYAEPEAFEYPIESTNLLYMNICAVTSTATTITELELEDATPTIFDRIALYACSGNTLTGARFNGAFDITGTYSNPITLNGKYLFDSNIYPSTAGGVTNYNDEPYITAALDLTLTFGTGGSYSVVSTNTPYPYVTTDLIFETILPKLVIGTTFKNDFGPITYYKGTVSKTYNGITATVTNPNLLNSYFLGIDTTNTQVQGSTPIFSFYITEFDISNTLETSVNQNITFTFTPNIPGKQYVFYLYNYNTFINEYINTWVALTKTSNTTYTCTLTKNPRYSVIEIGGFISNFSGSNLIANGILANSTSVSSTVSSNNFIINNNDGVTDLYKTKINGITGIQMDPNTNYSLAVEGTAFLSTGTTWTTSSDKRIKQNIEELDTCDALDFIKKAKVCKFKYDKRYKDDADKYRLGLIAQDLEKIQDPGFVPMVQQFGDIMLEKEKVEKLKTVDYSPVLFYLLAAAKELLK